MYSGLCYSSRPQSENERKRKERQVHGPCQRTKETVEHESYDNANYNWCDWNSLPRFEKGNGKLEIGGRVETT